MAKLASKDWEYKVLRVIEAIERGFAHGYIKRKMNEVANNSIP